MYTLRVTPKYETPNPKPLGLRKCTDVERTGHTSMSGVPFQRLEVPEARRAAMGRPGQWLQCQANGSNVCRVLRLAAAAPCGKKIIVLLQISTTAMGRVLWGLLRIPARGSTAVSITAIRREEYITPFDGQPLVAKPYWILPPRNLDRVPLVWYTLHPNTNPNAEPRNSKP